MENTAVTTNMIYEFLKEFKLEVYNRFDQVDKRMDRLETRMDSMETRLDARIDRLENQQKNLETQQKSNHELLMDIWQSRDKVTVNFSRGFMAANAAFSGIIAAIVALAVR
ncbi:MAG: hypothetical protein WC285_00435 [Candidatus Gracilibacteria bacterium]|jgi:hypothetical protein